MLFKTAILQGIRTGEVQLAYRRWVRPTVKKGSLVRTAVGVVAIDDVERVEARTITDADAQLAGFASKAALLESLRSEGALYRIALHYDGADARIALRSAPLGSSTEREDVLGALQRLDKRARGGPFTQRYLTLIDEAPGVVAAQLAARVGMETLPFKAQVRKLKELGLTESLEVGYRLSPRGREVLGTLRESPE